MRLAACLVTLLVCAVPSAAQTPVTSFTYVSQAGDYIGQGLTRNLTTVDGTFTASRNFDNGVEVRFQGPGIGDNWTLDFAAPMDADLAPGIYRLATRYPFQLASAPGLDVSGQSRGCNELKGEFTVIDVVYGAGGAVTSFAADFEQHCEGLAPALFGSIRYNYVAPPFTVSPRAIGVGAGANAVPITVVATPSTGVWSAVSNAPWLSVPASGSGGVFAIQVARNPSTSPRSGSVTVAGLTVTVDQRGNGVPGRPGRPAATVLRNQGHIVWAAADATAGGDATAYRLEAGLSPGTTLVAFDAATPAFDIAGVPPGRFYFRVRGTNEFGTGPTSDELTLNVSATGDTPPDPPQNLAVTVAQSSPTFAWSPPATGSAVTYRLEAGSSSGATDRAVVNLGPATSLAPGLVPAGVYFVRVRAIGAGGVSGPSNEVLLRIGALSAPPGPPGLTGSVAGNTVTFSWTPSTAGDAATRYVMEAGAEPGTTALVQTLASASTTATFAGVPPGRYYVRIRGVNARGTGPASNDVQILVP